MRPRELSRLVVPLHGSLEATEDLLAPFRLADREGAVVGAAAAFFAELSARGRPAALSAYDAACVVVFG